MALIATALASGASAQPQLCNGHADLCSRPFSETVFAGTHNSMAADDYGWNFAITTQTHTMRRQLDRGIRALSLDIHYAAPGLFGGIYNEDGPTRGNIEPYLCHQVCVLGSLKATIGFDAIAGFLRDNPNEVVVIYVEDYVSPEDLARALQATNLWQYVNDGPLTRTLGQMIASGKRAVFISQNRTSGYPWYPKLTAIGRDTDYDFKSTDQLTNPANLWNSCRPTPWGASGRGRILVMQHFVTPTTTGSRSASAVVNTRDVLTARALRCRDRHGVMPSILLVDYYELGDVVGATRALNDRYVPPPPGSAPACQDLSSCGTDPEQPDPAAVTSAAGGIAGAATTTTLTRLRIRSDGRRVLPRRGSVQLTIVATSSARTATTVPVRIAASRTRGIAFPSVVRLRVPASGSARRTIRVRAGQAAALGPLLLTATAGRTTTAVRMMVTAAGPLRPAVAG